MRHLRYALVALGLSIPAGAMAEQSPVVVELFTSQGCSSCPPADAFLLELAARDDVIPLALHVDYWDYIGWADSFAQPRFTERQKAYAHVAGSSSIYTPQMVVGGVDHVVGTHPAEVMALIAEHAAQRSQYTIEVSGQGRQRSVDLSTDQNAGRDMVVYLVTYEPRAEVEIHRGENAGREVTYGNIVTNWDTLARWNGRSDENITVNVPNSGEAVILLQAVGPGPILAAARVE